MMAAVFASSTTLRITKNPARGIGREPCATDSRHKYFIGRRQACVFLDHRDVHRLQPWLPLLTSHKRQQVLMLLCFQNGFEEGFERNRRSDAYLIELPTRLIRQLRKEVLPPCGAPEAMSSMAHTGAVDRIDNHSRLLGSFDSGVHVWVVRNESPAQSLNAAADHHDLAPWCVCLRPFFQRISQ